MPCVSVAVVMRHVTVLVAVRMFEVDRVIVAAGIDPTKEFGPLALQACCRA
jgi:hypothetical protein